MEKILAVADNNKDGKISFEEFVSVSNLNALLATGCFASSRISVMSLLSLVKSGFRDQIMHCFKVMMMMITITTIISTDNS